MHQIDKIINLTDRIAATANDPRNKKKITHSIREMLRQCINSLALGYGDLNDHDTLRKDTAIQAAVGKGEYLASRLSMWAGELGVLSYPPAFRKDHFLDRR